MRLRLLEQYDFKVALLFFEYNCAYSTNLIASLNEELASFNQKCTEHRHTITV